MCYFGAKIPSQVIEGINEKVSESHQTTQNIRHSNSSASQNFLKTFVPSSPLKQQIFLPIGKNKVDLYPL